jgi:hypothetical protein
MLTFTKRALSASRHTKKAPISHEPIHEIELFFRHSPTTITTMPHYVTKISYNSAEWRMAAEKLQYKDQNYESR